MTISEWMDLIFILVIVTIVLQKIVVLVVFHGRFRSAPNIAEEVLPTVSILIPARNEAGNLPACLDSLLQLNYPLDKIEILVGNDQSVDATADIVKGYGQQFVQIKLVNVQPQYHGLKARSNVLAQLAKKSSHKLLVFLDADMTVNFNWLREMVAPTKYGYNIVSGYTEVEGSGWLAQFQKVDWMSVIVLLKAGADIYKPGTALGNNMLVSRKAYDAVGGYEQIGPTFTEDNDLTLAAVKKGFLVFQLVVPGGARTLPMVTWSDLYRQRNRWMQGAFKQPFIRLIPLLLTRVYILFVALALVIDPVSAVGVLFLFSWVDLSSFWGMSRKIKRNVPVHIAIFAPVFNSLLDTFTLLTFPWNKGVIWKGRKLK
ncbi:MAG: glycosyltransferase [Roseivirga sp.]|nr:glycosyltransferase [Roseivirga sp.]